MKAPKIRTVGRKRTLTLAQIPSILKATTAADPSLADAAKCIDKRSLLEDIRAAKQNEQLASSLADRRKTKLANARLLKIHKAAAGLHQLLVPLCDDANGEPKMYFETGDDGWLRSRIMMNFSGSIEGLHSTLADLRDSSSTPISALNLKASTGQMFVGEGLKRVFESHFQTRAKRSRELVPGGADEFRTAVFGGFIAFAGAVLLALGEPRSPETISTMLSNRRRRATVGQI